MSFLKDLSKQIAKIDDVVEGNQPPRYWISSGNYALNKITTGSFHNCIGQGRISAIVGASGAGKSFLVGNIVKQAQDAGIISIIIDTENAFDDGYARAIGVDVDDKESYQLYQANTFESVTRILSTVVKHYEKDYGNDFEKSPKFLVIIDSLKMISTDTEAGKFDKGEENVDRGQHARRCKSMLKPLVNRISEKNISVLFTDHVYAASDEQIKKGTGNWVVTESIKYCASQILLVSKLKLKDLKNSSNVLGIKLKIEGYKVRYTKPFQSITLEVPYDSGIDINDGLLDMAMQYNVVTQKGPWYYYKDKNFYSKDIEKYAPDILNDLEQLNNLFVTISEEDAALEIVA